MASQNEPRHEPSKQSLKHAPGSHRPAGLQRLEGLQRVPALQNVEDSAGLAEQGTVSLRADVPAELLASMQSFIERHPNWDQYRLVQAAVAGFLVQNGSRCRGVTRCYLANLFPGQKGFTPGELTGRRQS